MRLSTVASLRIVLTIAHIVTVGGQCENPIVRQEWRTLSQAEQLAYITAVQCILLVPAFTLPFNGSGVISRYDDFVYTHIQETYSIHYVGQFLPWHRYFISAYEYALRNECNYTGSQPYWDWTLDVTSSTDFAASPVFDPVYGFGGNGPYVADNASGQVPSRTGGGCVPDGPFRNMTVHLGPTTNVIYNAQCLKRDFSPYFANRWLAWNQTILTLLQPNFGSLNRIIEGEPTYDDQGLHGAGHLAVGGTFGQMGDLFASPADPIFWLHHANVDRVWWSWQTLNLDLRLRDISGPIYLLDYDNIEGGNVTLNYTMNVGGNAPTVTVGDVMNISSGGGGGRVCYSFDKLYEIPY